MNVTVFTNNGVFKALMVTFMGQIAQTLTLHLYSACPSPQDTVGGNNPLLTLGLGKLLQLLEAM